MEKVMKWGKRMDVFAAVLLVVVALLVAVYELVAIFGGGQLGTVSEVLLAWSRRHPVIPLAAGILIGHLFWPQVGRR